MLAAGAETIFFFFDFEGFSSGFGFVAFSFEMLLFFFFDDFEGFSSLSLPFAVFAPNWLTTSLDDAACKLARRSANDAIFFIFLSDFFFLPLLSGAGG